MLAINLILTRGKKNMTKNKQNHFHETQREPNNQKKSYNNKIINGFEKCIEEWHSK